MNANLPVPVREPDDPRLDGVARAASVAPSTPPVATKARSTPPIPEPGSALLFGTGFLVLLARARQRRRERERTA